MESELIHKVFAANPATFDDLCLEIFHFQYANNALYRGFTDALSINARDVKQLNDIPFLPISFFKTHRVETTAFDPSLVFSSSGTTGSNTSHRQYADCDGYGHAVAGGNAG